jgi:cell wall-associated NlpC family hydrolase
MPALDPRINAFRPDLADISLTDSVKAKRYVAPTLRQCVRGVVPMLAEPKAGARQVSQVRYGEFLDIFEQRDDGFAWAQNRTDRYVGYIPSDDTLSDEIADLSNCIGTLTTFVYAEPNIKSAVIDVLTLGSHVRLGKKEGAFIKLMSGGYVFARHVMAAREALTPDYVFTAGRLLNVPYLWGGRTPQGIDCSGLVQLALEMAGIDCLRDSNQQREAFGKPLASHWRDVAWKRGDLVFFAGHVGIMTGAEHIVHASAHHMLVTVEPLIEMVGRGSDITAAGRP